MLKNKQIAINIYRDEHPYDTFSIVTIHSNTYAKYDENILSRIYLYRTCYKTYSYLYRRY